MQEELDKLACEFSGARQPAAWPVVAIMGCMVNGPGEAREADIAIAGGKGKAALYVGGKYKTTVKEGEIVAMVIRQVRAWHRQGSTVHG